MCLDFMCVMLSDCAYHLEMASVFPFMLAPFYLYN